MKNGKSFLFWTLACWMMLTGVGRAETSIDQVFRSLVSGQRPLEDLQIVYEIGNPDFRGKNMLELSGNGSIKLEHSETGKIKKFTGKVTEKSILTLLNEMEKASFWTFRSAAGSRQPDAAEITIRVTTRQGDLNFETTFLETEAMRSRQLRTMVRIFKTLLREVSAGEILA